MTAHVGESAGEITNAHAHMQLDTQTFVRTSWNTRPCSIQNMKTCWPLKCMEIKDIKLHCCLVRSSLQNRRILKKGGNWILNLKTKWPKTSLAKESVHIFLHIIPPLPIACLSLWKWQAGVMELADIDWLSQGHLSRVEIYRMQTGSWLQHHV